MGKYLAEPLVIIREENVNSWKLTDSVKKQILFVFLKFLSFTIFTVVLWIFTAMEAQKIVKKQSPLAFNSPLLSLNDYCDMFL
jgi:hypothetical protein